MTDQVELIEAVDPADAEVSEPGYFYYLSHYIVALNIRGDASSVNGNSFMYLETHFVPLSALANMAQGITQQTKADLMAADPSLTEDDIVIEDVVYGSISPLGYMTKTQFQASMAPEGDAPVTIH